MEKKFLLRINSNLFNQLQELSGEKSINEYLNQVLEEHVIRKKGSGSSMEKIVIDELKVKDVREAVTVTQRKWFMEILEEYNIYFFSATKTVTPMMYIFFYGDSSCIPAKCISHIGKVQHIYRKVDLNNIGELPELKELLQDSRFCDEILKWGQYQVAILSKVERLENPIPLTKEYVNHPKIIVNRTVNVVEAFAAKKMDDLF